MELPVAPQSYQPPAKALVRAIKRADRILARMAADETEADGFTAFTNPRRPVIHVNNFAAELNMPPGSSPEQLLDEIKAHFDERGCHCYGLVANEMDWPDDLAAAAEARGYRRRTGRVYCLANYSPPPRLNQDLQIIPARAAYGELRALYQACQATYDLTTEQAGHLADAHIDHLDEPRSESFLGRLGGKPVAVVNLVSLGQIGVIENVLTDVAVRNQGVATTLLAHTIDHCQRALFEQVVLETGPDNDTAQRLYDRLGFAPVVDYCGYHKDE